MQLMMTRFSEDLGPISVKTMQTSFQAYITWPKTFGMLIIFNLGIVVLDFGIVVHFDVDLFIFIVDCR
jgi:hypothetical protein